MNKVHDKSYPAATGTGAVVGGAAGGVLGGAAAGAAVGGMTGPVGAVVGAVVGAAAGAMAGKEVARAFDPAAEETYWADHYASRPYVTAGSSYADYAPAYRHGMDAYTRHPGKTFDEIEPQLKSDWTARRDGSSLEWERAKQASRDAWERVSNSVERAIPGDSDRDGR